MSDQIEIHDLLLRTIIGINPEERETLQDVVISLTMETDLRDAGCSDDIDQTVNYRTICKNVITLVEGSKYLLVEKLAQEVARCCLEDPRVQKVLVKVEKPGALRFARSVGVTIERSRDD
ncbi:MAG: dihydroneopterin aldolase [Planctomycetaceae bacterium]|nr:dihydroneopterin aldolase [Planctomycetaceae bacterium]